MTIYYDSKTGNVERFVEKLRERTSWQFIKISDSLKVYKQGHLITFTTRIGEVPQTTRQFLKQWHTQILSVSSSGNMNWGVHFARAADNISQEYNIPILLKFELAGLTDDVNNFIQNVITYADKKMDSPQQ